MEIFMEKREFICGTKSVAVVSQPAAFIKKAAVRLLIGISAVFLSVPAFSDELSDAMKGVPRDCPQWIIDNQAAIEVRYIDFDGNLKKGIIVADFRLAGDIQRVFRVALETGFPIRQVRPISEFGWDDFASMRADNTSAFNYRTVPYSKKMSNHAYGFAVDINTRENPYIKGDRVLPEGARYDVSQPGTLTRDHPVVLEFKKLGWRWGGDWSSSRDYQHFDRVLPKEKASGNKKYYPWK